jgi:predicted component of type VI protein secretion system
MNNRSIAPKVDTLENLSRYVEMANELKRTQFAKSNPYPFLVHVAPDARIEDNPWEEKVAFTTDVGAEDDEDDESDMPSTARAIVVPVRKREGGLFTQRIGVGRARNCDVVLRFPSVSKLHAQFLVDEAKWMIIDVESANGTLLNGERLTPFRPHAINFGDQLRMGEIAVEFADASTVFERLRNLRR